MADQRWSCSSARRADCLRHRGLYRDTPQRAAALRNGRGRDGVAGRDVRRRLLGVVIVIVLLVSHMAAAAPLASGRGGRLAALALRQIVIRSIITGLLLLAAGPLGGFLGALLGRLGHPRQPAVPKFAPAGFSPPFTPSSGTPMTPYLPTPPVYPNNAASATPAPYYPPSPLYDPNAPTNPSSPQHVIAQRPGKARRGEFFFFFFFFGAGAWIPRASALEPPPSSP